MTNCRSFFRPRAVAGQCTLFVAGLLVGGGLATHLLAADRVGTLGLVLVVALLVLLVGAGLYYRRPSRLFRVARPQSAPATGGGRDPGSEAPLRVNPFFDFLLE